MKRFAAAALLLTAAPAAMSGQTNTSLGAAAEYVWGQKAVSNVNGTSQFWFELFAVQGRSYCVEAGNWETGGYGDKAPDTELTVFRFDGATVLVTNDDAVEEPRAIFFSRACWVHSPGDEAVFVKLTSHSPTAQASVVTLRFLETTLYCPWFFIAGDYNAFSLLRNTSGSDLPGVQVTWRGLAGTIAGTTTVAVPANGTVILNARDFVNPSLFSNGSIEIAHAGSPDQIQGSTTTLSGTTGLGFDASFGQRRPW